jgi:hypothetical protein
VSSDDESAATRAVKCRTCGATRNTRCRARPRYRPGYLAPARRPHKARMDDWRAMVKAAPPGAGGGEREGST